MATAQPPFSGPSIRSAGTTTSSKNTSVNSRSPFNISIGDTVIGRGSKLDNLVQVAHNVRIGPHCILTGQVGIAGSTTLGARVMMGGQSGVIGHLVVGDGVRVAAKSVVFRDVPAGSIVMGTPAADQGPMRRAWALIPRLPELFRRLRALEGEDRGRARAPAKAP